jgi:predicted transcriptional regulator
MASLHLAPAKPVTVRLEDGMRAALDEVAAAMGRDRSWVVKQALEEYLAAQSWQLRHIQAAVAEADAGDFAGDEAVAARFARWGAKPV